LSFTAIVLRIIEATNPIVFISFDLSINQPKDDIQQ
jgi:hypothetical protein